ncbi:hypothetical protein CBR_g8652 [Chara braunii]|uniref:VHS domain-containing protein n=1 Tax=Chara braunii TaxID=69332 RepID=A0A388JSD3_CHABU|nr:hypothetical protein CBR_g8652 [Chara braunii]|eukprot:GBG60632.1 hypothetical protein CBR_g8652 [Chara braunii]
MDLQRSHGKKVPISSVVHVATRSMLQTLDWGMTLTLVDGINRGPQEAKEAVKALRKRLQEKNVAVQMLTLTVLDTCMKNCGDNFHNQVASREILSDMVKLVLSKKCDNNVRLKVLGLVDTWQLVFGGPTGKYPQFFHAYDKLWRKNVQFPQRQLEVLNSYWNVQGNTDAIPAGSSRMGPTSVPNGWGASLSGHRRNRLRSRGVLAEGADLPLTERLDIFGNMVKVLSELSKGLSETVDSPDTSRHGSREDGDTEALEDLIQQCQQESKWVQEAIQATSDQDLLWKALCLNDELQVVLAKHESIVHRLNSGEGGNRFAASKLDALDDPYPEAGNSPSPRSEYSSMSGGEYSMGAASTFMNSRRRARASSSQGREGGADAGGTSDRQPESSSVQRSGSHWWTWRRKGSSKDDKGKGKGWGRLFGGSGGDGHSNDLQEQVTTPARDNLTRMDLRAEKRSAEDAEVADRLTSRKWRRGRRHLFSRAANRSLFGYASDTGGDGYDRHNRLDRGEFSDRGETSERGEISDLGDMSDRGEASDLGEASDKDEYEQRNLLQSRLVDRVKRTSHGSTDVIHSGNGPTLSISNGKEFKESNNGAGRRRGRRSMTAWDVPPLIDFSPARPPSVAPVTAGFTEWQLGAEVKIEKQQDEAMPSNGMAAEGSGGQAGEEVHESSGHGTADSGIFDPDVVNDKELESQPDGALSSARDIDVRSSVVDTISRLDSADDSYAKYSDKHEDMDPSAVREENELMRVVEPTTWQEGERPIAEENASSRLQVDGGSISALLSGSAVRLRTESESLTVARSMPSLFRGDGEHDSCEDENEEGFSILGNGVIGAYDRAEMGVGPEINARVKMGDGESESGSVLEAETRDDDKEFERDEDGWTDAWEDVNEDMREDMSEGTREELRMAMQQQKQETVKHCDDDEKSGEAERDEQVESREGSRSVRKKSSWEAVDRFEDCVNRHGDDGVEDPNDALGSKVGVVQPKDLNDDDVGSENWMDRQVKDTPGMRPEDRSLEAIECAPDMNFMDTDLQKLNDLYWGSTNDVNREVDIRLAQRKQDLHSGSINSPHDGAVVVPGEVVAEVEGISGKSSQFGAIHLDQEGTATVDEVERELTIDSKFEGNWKFQDREGSDRLAAEQPLNKDTDRGSGGETLEAVGKLPMCVVENQLAREIKASELEDRTESRTLYKLDIEQQSDLDSRPAFNTPAPASSEVLPGPVSAVAMEAAADTLSIRVSPNDKEAMDALTPSTPKSPVFAENSPQTNLSPNGTNSVESGSGRRSSLGEWWLKQTSPGAVSPLPVTKSDEMSTPKPLGIAGWTVWGSLTRPRAHRHSALVESPVAKAIDKESHVPLSPGLEQPSWARDSLGGSKGGGSSSPEDGQCSPVSEGSTDDHKIKDAGHETGKDGETEMDRKTADVGEGIQVLNTSSAPEIGREKDEEPVSMGMKEGLSSLFRWGDSFVQKRFGRKAAQANSQSIPQDDVLDASREQCRMVGLSPSAEDMSLPAETREVQGNTDRDEVQMEQKHVPEHMQNGRLSNVEQVVDEIYSRGEGVLHETDTSPGSMVHREVGIVAQQSLNSEDSVGANRAIQSGEVREELEHSDEDAREAVYQKSEVAHTESSMPTETVMNRTEEDVGPFGYQDVLKIDKNNNVSIDEDSAGSDKSCTSSEEGTWPIDRSSEACTDEESEGRHTHVRALLSNETRIAEKIIDASSDDGDEGIGMPIITCEIDELVAAVEKELTHLEMAQQNDEKMEVEVMEGVCQSKVIDGQNQKGRREVDSTIEKSHSWEELDTKQDVQFEHPKISKEKDQSCGSSTQSLDTGAIDIILQEEDALYQRLSCESAGPMVMPPATPQTVSLVGLPGEALLSIFGFCSDQDLCNVSATCHTLRDFTELVWMRKCEKWASEVDLTNWRSHVDSNMALYRFLRTCSPLVGGWTYGTYSYAMKDRVDLVMVFWGFMSVVACSFSQPIVPRKASLEWKPMFEIVGDYDGSCSIFYFAKTEGRPLIFPGVLSLSPSQYPNKMRIRPRPCKGYSAGGRAMGRSWSGEERKRRVSSSVISRRDRFRVLLMEAKRLTTWVQQNASAVSGIWGTEWRRHFGASMKSFTESPSRSTRPVIGWTLGTGRKVFSSSLQDVSETPLSGPGSDDEMAKWAFPIPVLQMDTFFAKEGAREKRLDIIRQLIAVRKLQMPGWDTGVGLDNNGAALQFMLQTPLSEWQLEHSELFYPDSAEGVDGPEAAYLGEQDASPHQIVRMYEGDGITQQGYGFRYHRYMPGRLFRQRNGGVFFSWDQSQALLQLKRLDVAELLKESCVGEPADVSVDASSGDPLGGMHWIF